MVLHYRRVRVRTVPASSMLTYVINLDRDTSRLAHMEAQTRRAGLEFERFSALDGARIPEHLRSQFFAVDGTQHEPELTAGEIGCYASHLAVLKCVASDLNHPYALVLEDDVALSEDLLPLIASAAVCAQQWDIIRLCNPTKSVTLSVETLLNRELVRYWTVPNSSAAYLISRTGAEKFLSAYEQRKLPIDEALRRPWRTGLNMLGILPPPVGTDACSTSSISSMGRPSTTAARHRFKDASPVRDILPGLNYRMKAFGPHAFCRALVREPLVAAVRRLFGREAAEPFLRVKV